MTKKVFINVYDNDGIVDFAKKLQDKYAFEIYAASNSYDYLKNSGLTVTEFDGKEEDFDIVVCNFFPFDKYINKNIDENDVLGNFDHIGFSLLEKSSLKYKDTLTVTSPKQYAEVEEYLENGATDEQFRKKYARKALLLICKINSDLINITGGKEDFIFLNAEKTEDLIYGENPHQKAALYDGKTLSYEIITNQDLSYNNFLDINLATAIISEFFDVNATVITRHAMPCAAALGKTLEDAYNKATDCDPISAMGGVIAFSQKLDKNTAKLLSSMFLEIIIAPDFEEDAIEILKTKDLKIIKINTPLKDYKKYLQKEILQTPFGILVQDFNEGELNKNTFKVVTKKKPTAENVEDMVFAWKISKHTRSNSAIVVKDLKTVGIAQGQSNKIEAIDIALDRACENTKDAILVTDGFISTTDGIADAAQARIIGIIQPGGSKRDKEITAAADKYGITMITTGLRQFKNK